MGSSPVTATTSAPGVALGDGRTRLPDDALRDALLSCLRDEARVDKDDLLLVAFSGGPDSTALLLGLSRLAPDLGCRLLAAHVDHRLDAGSAARAAAAVRLAARLAVDCRVQPAPAGAAGGVPREGREAAARRLRYSLLENLREELGARFILTAHHADDQAETVLLRLALGSGLAGLAGIPSRRGALLRPLLALSRAELATAVTAAGLEPVEDPTNGDLGVPRNRLRHQLLPALGGSETAARARAVATAAGSLATGLEGRLAAMLPELGALAAPALPLAVLRRLPDELLPWALAMLHRRAGAAYPPRATAVAELRRQLARADGHAIACDCGGGWRWLSDHDGRLHALAAIGSGPDTESGRSPAAAADLPFAYTVDVPGGVEIKEAGTTFRLSRQPVAAWMRRGSPGRAALDLPLAPGGQVTVRNRRPGDRLQPFGSAHRRRLKDLLIDRKVPRAERDRLPLLCVAGQVAWVPGITIHHPFRLREGAAIAWVAELSP